MTSTCVTETWKKSGFTITKYISNRFSQGFYFKATCPKTHKNGCGASETSAMIDLIKYIDKGGD